MYSSAYFVPSISAVCPEYTYKVLLNKYAMTTTVTTKTNHQKEKSHWVSTRNIESSVKTSPWAATKEARKRFSRDANTRFLNLYVKMVVGVISQWISKTSSTSRRRSNGTSKTHNGIIIKVQYEKKFWLYVVQSRGCHITPSTHFEVEIKNRHPMN